MATHSSARARRILWTEEPGGLLSMGSHRVGHDWSDLACLHALEKEMATPSSVLTWRIPGTEGPGGLPSMGLYSQTWLKRLRKSRFWLWQKDDERKESSWDQKETEWHRDARIKVSEERAEHPWSKTDCAQFQNRWGGGDQDFQPQLPYNRRRAEKQPQCP